MDHDHKHHEGAAKLYELIKDVRIAMMTTVEADGSLHSRPMYNHKADEAGDLWFFTRAQTPKVAELKKDSQVNLAYADPSNQNYVSVSGKAEIVTDKAKAKELWSTQMEAWFPQGPEDESVVLIKVTGKTAEYWEGPGGRIATAFSLLKVKVTGERYSGGENEVVEL